MYTCFELMAASGGWTGRLRNILHCTGGVEIVPAIAAIHTRNHSGVPCIAANILDVDPATVPATDILMLSPVCKSFSRAKVGGVELQSDIDVAIKCATWIDDWAQRGTWAIFVENVRGYVGSISLGHITAALDRNGYEWGLSIEDAACWGVPQNRNRMIIRAVKGRRLPVLQPTHSRTGDMFTAPWNGWYDAIEDLIDTLPLSQFARWQELRFPKWLRESFLMKGTNAGQEWGKGYRQADEPSACVEASCKGMPRAYLVHASSSDLTIRAADDPSATMMASSHTAAPRAFPIGSGNTNTTQIDSKPRWDSEPMFTIPANHAGLSSRAFIVDCQNNGAADESGMRGLTIRQAPEPMFTVTSSASKRVRSAWMDCGEVRQMTPRTLARFQSLPDDYYLPESNKLACEIVGNAVPSLMARSIIMQTLGMEG